MIRLRTLILLLATTAGFAAVPQSLAVEPLAIDFASEIVGAEPGTFTATVGNWSIVKDGDNSVLMVDGTTWSRGQSSAGLADKARALYGERYGEFLDNVKAYAYFPLAVVNAVPEFRQGDISVHFKGITGRIDQGAGIVFNLKVNGDYLVLRANCLEDNLVLFKVEHGQRSPVKWIRNTPTASLQWHSLKVIVQGKHIRAYLDGKLTLEDDLSETVSGRIGLWSKADSKVYFDDFRVSLP